MSRFHPDHLSDKDCETRVPLATYRKLYEAAEQMADLIEDPPSSPREWSDLADAALANFRTGQASPATGHKGSDPTHSATSNDVGQGAEVPDEAVEAGAKALADPAWDADGGDLEWSRQALTAALPHLEAAIRADERAKIRKRVAEIDWDRGLPELVYSQEQEEAFRAARRAALTAIEEVGNEQ